MTQPTNPGYPFLDGPQQMYHTDPGEGSATMPDPTIQDMSQPLSVLNTAQQVCRDNLRGSDTPMPDNA